jgi:prepilin-type N-terminal cleavage/methylation domain-containing protein
MRRSDERGFTLPELLVGMTITLIVLSASLTTFENYTRAEGDNDKRNDTTEVARNALDIQARQLRNLAKRVASPVIDTLAPYDLIFQTSDPAKTWVRYCLDTTTAPASTERARLWTAELAVPSAGTPVTITSAMRSGCPGAGWTTTQVVADYITNKRTGTDRAMFQYTCSAGTTCTASPATYDQVVSITNRLLVDTTPGRDAPELNVISSVFLRNQNQAPVATFAWTRASTSRTITLNAAGSSDYEGRTLDYYWFKTNFPATTSVDCAHPTVAGTGSPRTLWGVTGFIGDGVTLTYTFPSTDGTAGTTKNFGLVTCDPGDRFDVFGISPKALVVVPIPT